MISKYAIYSIAVACFILAGVQDAFAGAWKPAILAFLFAACNGIIFLWR